jgi:hypothetical protein
VGTAYQATRDTTETKQDNSETKQNETKETPINKKAKQTLQKRFLLHEATIHKMPVAELKTFKIYGRIWLWEKNIIRMSYQKAHHCPASCMSKVDIARTWAVKQH